MQKNWDKQQAQELSQEAAICIMVAKNFNHFVKQIHKVMKIFCIHDTYKL